MRRNNGLFLTRVATAVFSGRRSVSGCVVRRSLSSSSAASDNDDLPTDAKETSPVSNLYMWGTDSSGSVLQPPPSQRLQADKKQARFDIPMSVDWKAAMNITAADEEKESNDDVKVVKVICGATDTAWILSDGRCFVSGENKQGQLGQGHKKPIETPVQVTIQNDKGEVVPIRDACLGPNHAAFVDAEMGDLYTCGFGGSTFAGMGALGHGDSEEYLTPTRVESLVEDGCSVAQVQIGEAHMTVLTTEGEVLTTGAGSYGRLGNFETRDQLYLEPTEVLTPATGITQIAGGKSFTLALAAAEGVVYGWGRNHKGQLGTGLGLAVDMYAMQAVPEPIEDNELVGRKVTHIAAGHSHAACITAGGELFLWGMSLHLEPVRVHELLHTKIVHVACGQDYTLAVDEDGKVYSWGKGGTGCLGQGGVKTANQAALVESLQDYRVEQISAGWKHAACLVKDA